MSKPVKFEPFTIRSHYGGAVTLAPRISDGTIYVGWALQNEPQDYKNGNYVKDPDDLEALADACKRAAAALREAQTLTFADLKPGEWFRWDTNTKSVLLKVDANTIVVPANANCDTEIVREISHDSRTAVVHRLTATFTPVTP